MRILVVEDQPRLAATIAEGLTLDGFDCDVTHDGADGLWRATNASYSAIVLDLLLPSTNGFNVCRALRDNQNWTPVLVLTAKSGDYDLVEALECGADDFLLKPFSFAVLTARLRALIRRGHVPRPDALDHGDVWFDPFTRRCAIAGADVELTAREAQVLHVLLRRGDGIVSRDQLLAEVWGIDFDGNPMIVDVYISHLRKKLDGAASNTQIANHRGLGFALRHHD